MKNGDVYGILMALDGHLMGFHGDLMGCHRISWDCNGEFLSPLMILKTSHNKHVLVGEWNTYLGSFRGYFTLGGWDS